MWYNGIVTVSQTMFNGNIVYTKMGETMYHNNERGSSGIETAIIMVCLVVVAAVFVMGMIGAMEKTETQMSGNSDGMHTACTTLCRARFLDGATDVAKFNACMTKCDAKYTVTQ